MKIKSLFGDMKHNYGEELLKLALNLRYINIHQSSLGHDNSRR